MVVFDNWCDQKDCVFWSLIAHWKSLCLIFFAFFPAAPKFAHEPSDVASDISSNVTLLCRAEGHPEPQITWKRADGYSLFNRPRIHGSVLQKKGDLHITSMFINPLKGLALTSKLMQITYDFFFCQIFGWMMKQNTSVKHKTNLGGFKPWPASLWPDLVNTNSFLKEILFVSVVLVLKKQDVFSSLWV